MPTIRLGGEQEPWSDGDGPGSDRAPAQPPGDDRRDPDPRDLRQGRGRRRPCCCTAGSTTPTPGSRCSTASRSPGARRSPTTCPGSARRRRSGPGRCSTSSSSSPPTRSRRPPSGPGRKVVVAGNSLGGWAALRLAERGDLPLAGIVPIGPAGIRMAPAFFTLDRVPGRLADHRPAGAAAAARSCARSPAASTAASRSPTPPASTRPSSTASPASTSSAA